MTFNFFGLLCRPVCTIIGIIPYVRDHVYDTMGIVCVGLAPCTRGLYIGNFAFHKMFEPAFCPFYLALVKYSIGFITTQFKSLTRVRVLVLFQICLWHYTSIDVITKITLEINVA